MIGRPAASAEVQPSGRSAFERRLNTAPEPASQPAPRRRAEYSSYSLQAATLQHEHVPVTFFCQLPRRVRRPGSGMAPARIRRRYSVNVIGHPRLARADDRVGDAVARVGAEVGVQMSAQADARDVLRRARIDRSVGDVPVERVARGEDRTGVLAWATRRMHARGGSSSGGSSSGGSSSAREQACHDDREHRGWSHSLQTIPPACESTPSTAGRASLSSGTPQCQQ